VATLISGKPANREDNLVVVIDDDEVMRLSCEHILSKVGYRVETYSSGREGLRRLQDVRPPVVVVDIKMPEQNGLEVMAEARKLDPDLVVVVITGYATVETAVDAMKAGAYDFLPKPFTPVELRMIIDRGFERWRLIKEAQRLRKEKEDVERRFVTLVSHQLKTPLVAVKQYLDVLHTAPDSGLPEKAMEWITRSRMRLDEMLALIHDLLALARIERGTHCDRSATSSLAAIVNELVDEQRQSPGCGALTFSVSLPPDLPPVAGDPTSIQMLVGNLLGNAVKYNRPGGSILVAARPAGDSVTLEVTDSGIGIPADCIPSLFQDFYRVKTKETEGIAGTGLGLVICNRIVAELGGSIELTSKEGEGTTFLVHLPAAKAPTRGESPS
jgi:signal transduction histidine kinase